MGEPNTTQVEGLDFVVKDHAAPAAERISKSFEHVHHAAEGAREKISEMTHHLAMSSLAAVGVGIGFHAMAEKAAEANLELEDAAKKIAGVQYTFGGWKAGTTGQEKWNESLAEGTEVVEKLEKAEGKLRMRRGELADVYASSFALGQRHNLNQEQQIALTEKLGAVQKTLGVSAEFAATQVYRMAMTGNARGFDNFSKKMKESVGNLKAFAKLSEEKRFEKLQKAMGDMIPAAEGMGAGARGAIFDIRKSFDEMTRDFTGPVFKEVTKEIGVWAQKVTHIREDGKSIAHEYGEKLVDAFHAMEKATGFISDHWKAIAAIWAGAKLADWAKAPAAAGGLMSSLGGSAGAVSGKLVGMAGKVGLVTEGLGLLYVGLQGAATLLDEWHSGKISKQAQFGEGSAMAAGAGTSAAAIEKFREMADKDLELGRANIDTAKQARQAYTSLRGAYGEGVIGAGGKVNISAAKEAYATMDAESRERQLRGLGLDAKNAYYSTDKVQTEFADRLAQIVGQLIGAGGVATSEANNRKTTRPPVTNIRVEHLEITQDFKQADPDRIFHRIPGDIADMVANPRGSTLHLVPG